MQKITVKYLNGVKEVFADVTNLQQYNKLEFDYVYQKDQSARHAIFRLDKIAGYTMKKD